MVLSDKWYDILKWIVWVFLPALTVLVGVVGEALGYGNLDTVMTVMTAVTTFLGTITGVSNRNYHKKEDKKEKQLDQKQ